MIPTKALILTIDTDLSREYASMCAESCERVGLPYEYFNGYYNMTTFDCWNETGIDLHPLVKRKLMNYPVVDRALCCTAGHAAMWKKISEGNECTVILEHDAIMLHKPTIDVSDDLIVTLGYKVTDPEKYDHVKAGPPKRLLSLSGHEGAHAYALTPRTARYLIKEIEKKGIMGYVDNIYFLKSRLTKIPLSIADPTPAIGWLRSSTIWPESSVVNYDFIPSFKENYTGVYKNGQ